MAQVMGQRIESKPGSGTSLIDLEIYRRMWWTLFMADCWSSSSLALPRLINDAVLTLEVPMDEVAFESLSPDSMELGASWQPGLWAHMISLVRLFAPIQDLNRRSAEGGTAPGETERVVASLSRQLESWAWMLPSDAKMSDDNLEKHRLRGTGGPFVALHLGYFHYSTLLYFRFLEPQPSMLTSSTSHYRDKCTYHAFQYSHLLRKARMRGQCEVVYPTVGHMAVVSSSVLLYTLLFGEESELQTAREAMNSNFEAIIELRQYWPNTGPMVSYL